MSRHSWGSSVGSAGSAGSSGPAAVAWQPFSASLCTPPGHAENHKPNSWANQLIYTVKQWKLIPLYSGTLSQWPRVRKQVHTLLSISSAFAKQKFLTAEIFFFMVPYLMWYYVRISYWTARCLFPLPSLKLHLPGTSFEAKVHIS